MLTVQSLLLLFFQIPSTDKGIVFSEHPFWKEKYCPCHDSDGTAKCCSCERLEVLIITEVLL